MRRLEHYTFTSDTNRSPMMTWIHETPIDCFLGDNETRLFVMSSNNNSVAEYRIVDGNLGGIIFTGKEFWYGGTVSGTGLRFNPEGTKMYILGPNPGLIFVFTLSIPWDLDTCTYDGNDKRSNLSLGASRIGFDFSHDGNYIFAQHLSAATVKRWELTESWNVQTMVDATTVANSTSVSVSGLGNTNHNKIRLAANGQYFYVTADTGPGWIKCFEMAESYNLNTSSYHSHFSVNVHAYDVLAGSSIFQFKDISAIEVADDGSYVIVGCQTYDHFLKFEMPTPYFANSVNELNNHRWGKNFISATSAPVRMNFADNGKYMYVNDGSTTWRRHEVLEGWPRWDPVSYALGVWTSSAYDSTWPDNFLLYYGSMHFINEGKNLLIVGMDNENDYPTQCIRKYTLGTPYDISNANTVYWSGDLINDQLNLREVIGGDWLYTKPKEIRNSGYNSCSHFTDNGLNFYYIEWGAVDNSGDGKLYHIKFSSPWDFTTATYAGKIDSPFLLAIDHALPDWYTYGNDYHDWYANDIIVSPDGRQLLIQDGNQGSSQYLFGMSTPFELSTAQFIRKLNLRSTPSADIFPLNYAFAQSPDGKYLYLSDWSYGQISRLEMLEANNYATATSALKVRNMTGPGERTIENCYNLNFNPEGTKCIYLAFDYILISQFTMSVPWEIGTSQHDYSHILWNDNTVGSSHIGIHVHPDGNIIYALMTVNSGANSRSAIQTFQLGESWNLRSMISNTSPHILDPNEAPTNIDNFVMNPDGTSLYYFKYDETLIYEYTMSEAWNVQTAQVSTTANLHLIAPDYFSMAQLDSFRRFTINNAGDTLLWTDGIKDKIELFYFKESWNLAAGLVYDNTYEDKYNWFASYNRPILSPLTGDFVGGLEFANNDNYIFQINYSGTYQSMMFQFTYQGDDKVSNETINVGNWLNENNESANLHLSVDDMGLGSKGSNLKSEFITYYANSSQLILGFANTMPSTNNKYFGELNVDINRLGLDIQANLSYRISITEDETVLKTWTGFIGKNKLLMLREPLSKSLIDSIGNFDNVRIKIEGYSTTNTNITINTDGDTFGTPILAGPIIGTLYTDVDVYGTTIVSGPLIVAEFDDSIDTFGSHTLTQL